MKIIIDAMGGDNAPEEIVKGALEAVDKSGIEIVLCGRGEDILRVIEGMGHKELPRGVEIVDASEVIDKNDDPASAVRLKKDSSLTVAFGLLRDGRGDALVSAGSTGAVLSGATLIVKRARGIRRAALAPFIPNATGGFILIDCGANSECNAEFLLQFAFMGSFYAEDVLMRSAPRVGLLNNGAERTKGAPLQLEAYALLEKASMEGQINFVGNIEAADAIKGACDVLVCDGFTGNVFLKSLEGMAAFIISELKTIYNKNWASKMSALIIKKSISELKLKLSPDEVGGTALLGITKPVIKAHGASNSTAFRSAVYQAAKVAKTGISSRLESSIAQMKTDKELDI